MAKKVIKRLIPRIIGFQLNAQFRVQKKKALKKAFLLFSTPQKGGVKPHQIDFLTKAKNDVSIIDDTTIQTYHWPGNGKTVLLIHGWDSNTYRWKSLIEKLTKQDYNVFAFDAPAHGYSSGQLLNVPLYANVLNSLIKTKKPKFLIGHSIGAMTIIYHQHTFGNTDGIEKLVLLGAPSKMEKIMSDYKQILRLTDRFMDALNHFFKDKFGFFFEEFSMGKFAKSITSSSLIIHDQYDKVAPISSAYDISNNLKNCELIVTEGAGHSLKNHDVDKNIISFIES